jgi:hypothetical protein
MIWRWIPPRTRDELRYDPITGKPLTLTERERWWQRFHPPHRSRPVPDTRRKRA